MAIHVPLHTLRSVVLALATGGLVLAPVSVPREVALGDGPSRQSGSLGAASSLGAPAAVLMLQAKAGLETTQQAQPAATLVPAGALAQLGVDTPSGSVTLAVGAHMALDPGSTYTLGPVSYDPFMLEPVGQLGDGATIFSALDWGATYLSAVATPNCLRAPQPCQSAAVPLSHLIVVGNLPPAKLAAALQEAQARATALAVPTGSLVQAQAKAAASLATRIAVEPTAAPYHPYPAIKAGSGAIVQSGMSALPPQLYNFQNHWFEDEPDWPVVVWAGALAQDLEQGVVVVDAEGNEISLRGEYLTPGRDGSVRVISAIGEQLTLQATDGTTFVFDLPSHSFLGSSAASTSGSTADPTVTDQPVATSTPALPTDTPT